MIPPTPQRLLLRDQAAARRLETTLDDQTLGTALIGVQGPQAQETLLPMTEGVDLDDALRQRIARELRTALSPRHVPDEIHQVRAVPRTLSAKKLEVPVKKILTGTPVDRAAATGALANPESLQAFADFATHRSGSG